MTRDSKKDFKKIHFVVGPGAKQADNTLMFLNSPRIKFDRQAPQ